MTVTSWIHGGCGVTVKKTLKTDDSSSWLHTKTWFWFFEVVQHHTPNIIWIIESNFFSSKLSSGYKIKENIWNWKAIVLQTLISDHYYNFWDITCFLIYICWFTLHVGKSQLNMVINYNNFITLVKTNSKSPLHILLHTKQYIKLP